MKTAIVAREAVTKAFGIVALASVLAGLLWSSAASAQTATPPAAQPPKAPISAQSLEAWRATMARTPKPQNGCFTAAYPSTEWKEVPCAAPRPRPFPPAAGQRPLTVGNSTDWTANSATGAISQAIGSFDSVTGVTSETDSDAGAANTFSLQLNTNRFTTSNCSSSATCVGWQQFLFSTNGCTNAQGTVPCAFMQYWMIFYNQACPTGWNTNNPPSPPWPANTTNCWKNGTNGAVVPAQTIAGLSNMILTGTAAANGNDTVTISVGNPPNAQGVGGADNILNLAAGWQVAEFNIFGDCCNSQANLNNGSTLVVRLQVNEGAKLAPTCVQAGFTGETNNLNLVGTPTIVPQTTLPAIVFTESNAPGGTPASCATSQGDTHLTTFAGTHYDFQAAGDFVLAQSDPDFIVQNRQASGAPTWPNAAVNKAVATQMGKTVVAVCVAPTRLVIDGKLKSLADGQSLALPDGVTVSRSGTTFDVRRKNGDSVRAEVNHIAQPLNDWINVSVGLGDMSLAPKVRGLLGNPNGDINEIATRTGTVLKEPVSFDDLYNRYGDSWRAPPDLLTLCNDPKVTAGNPAKPFYATDLNADQRERAQAICKAAGVKNAALLDDCILDVTVLGGAAAAKVFAQAPSPVAVVNAGVSDKR
jgi:hypothetical protein